MQCPWCKARLPMNLEFKTCPRCGRALGKSAPVPETSSPSLELDVGADFWHPRHLVAGTRDVVELVFSPRTAWEHWVMVPGQFLGRRSPPGYAALVMGTLGAVVTALGMHIVGDPVGVGEYSTARTWAWVMVAIVPAAWVVVAWMALAIGRRWARNVLPAAADARETRQNASRVAVLSGAPGLVSSWCAALWVVPDVGPFLAVVGCLYCATSVFQGAWRGAGMLMDLGASERRALVFKLAVPFTLLYAAAGGTWLVALAATYP